MLLYGNSESGHSYKVRSFLLLANVEHEYRWIDLNTPRSKRPADFVAASKFGEVPVLVDEGRAMCQSNAILVYLAQKFGVFGGGSSQWQSVLEWLSWETNRIGFSVPNLRFSLRWDEQPPDVMSYLRGRAMADLRTLDQFLSSSEYLLQAGPTIADISCSAYLFWLSQAGIAEAEFPHVQRWLSSLSRLRGWQHPDEALARPTE
ncbi:glutathione S-transferase family protein [Trinickia dabaoshanensis]|nr:glutathione S-transferase family protein [Trinickia dabaoshanensis]